MDSFYIILIGVALTTFTVRYLFEFVEATDSKKKRFRETVAMAIRAGNPNLNDIDVIANQMKQDRKSIHGALSDLFVENITSATEESREELEKVRVLMDELNLAEPYAGLPESIRIRMEEVRAKFGDEGDENMRPLATAVSDTVVEAERKAKRQSQITFWSFLIGILSLLMGTASLYFSVNQIMEASALKKAEFQRMLEEKMDAKDDLKRPPVEEPQ